MNRLTQKYCSIAPLLQLFVGVFVYVFSCAQGFAAVPAPNQQPLMSVYYSPAVVDVGKSSRLYWSTANISRCELLDGTALSLGTNGSGKSDLIIESYTKTTSVRCYSNKGVITRNATLTINGAASLSSASISSGAGAGSSALPSSSNSSSSNYSLSISTPSASSKSSTSSGFSASSKSSSSIVSSHVSSTPSSSVASVAPITLSGSNGFGYRTAALPDGKIVVSQRDDTEVKVFNPNGTVFGSFKPCNKPCRIASLGATAEGNIVVGMTHVPDNINNFSYIPDVSIYSGTTLTYVNRLGFPYAITGDLAAVAVSPQLGGAIAVSVKGPNDNGLVFIFASNFAFSKYLHKPSINAMEGDRFGGSIAASRTGDFVASYFYKDPATQNAQTALARFTMNADAGNFLYAEQVILNSNFVANSNPSLAIDFKGNLLVADGYSRVSTYKVGRLFVYSLATGQLLQEIVNPIEHNSSPFGITVTASPISNHVLVSGYDSQRSTGVVYVYTGQLMLGQIAVLDVPVSVYAIAASSTGGVALGMYELNTVRLYPNYFSPPPVIQQFYAEPSTLIKGNSTLLKWQVSGATSLSISPATAIAPGATSVSVSPAETTAYTLTATNASGSASRQLMLTVKEPDYDNDAMPDPWETTHGLNISLNDALLDLDGDGLNNIGEFNVGTKPNIADTDGDGMFDGYEVQHGLNPLSADHLADHDADGLNNLSEFLARTNPKKADTDSDGLSDSYEVNHLLNPLVADSNADADNDGLTNLKEFQANTNPQNPDTDTDGMLDGYEVTHGLNPLVADNHLDSDDDGLTNLVEHNLGTNPKSKDTDNDGMPDAFEVAVGLNPLLGADAATDVDGDGVSNYYEYLAGTDLNLNTDYPFPQTVTNFSAQDLPCETANCYALISWNIDQYSTACIFDQAGVKQVCAASGSIKVLKDPLYQKNYKILEYPVASSREIGAVAINNSRINSWGRITPASNGPCTLNSSTGECIKNTSVNYSRKTGEQHVTMWRVNPASGLREEVQRFYNGAVFNNYSLIAPNQKGYVYELREGISSSGVLLHSYVSWKNEKATPPPALNATPQNCVINEEHETCIVQVHWDKASMGNAAQYCLMNGAELINCTADNFVNVTVGIRPLHLQLRSANSVNVNVLSDVFVKAVVSAGFKLDAPSCVPTYGNSCTTSVSWSAQESTNPCLFKDGQLVACAKAGRLDLPVSTSGTSFSLRNGSIFSSSAELSTMLAKVEDNWLSLSSNSCDIRYPDTQCRIHVSWAVKPTESACIYQNGEELFCGVNGNKDVLLNAGTHEFSLRQNGSAVRTMTTNVKNLPWGKLTFPAFTKTDETVQRPGGKNCLLAPGQIYCTVRMDAIFQNVSRSNYVTLWRMYEGQWQLFNKKAIGELINGVFQNEYDFVTSEAHEYRLTWRSDDGAPSPNDLLLDQAVISGVAAPNYEYSLKAPKNYCYYAEGESSCKVNVSWLTDDVRFTSLCVEGQGISGLPLCKPSAITGGKWQGEIEVDVPKAGKKLLLRDSNLLLIYRELNLYAIKGLDFLNVSECSYSATGVCSVTVIWNATAAKNCIYSEILSAPVACTNNTNGNGMVTFDVTDMTGGNFYLAADTNGIIEKLTSFEIDYTLDCELEANAHHPACYTPPNIPGGIIFTGLEGTSSPTDTNGSFIVNWGASDEAESYWLEENGVLVYSGVEPDYNAVSLTSGNYTYRVKACKDSAANCSDFTEQKTVSVIINSISSNSSSSANSNESSSSANSIGVSSSISSLPIVQSPYLTDGNVNSPPPTELPGSPVGTIAGQFRVSESGAASYSVPLNLPAGVAGVTPQLSFDYSSQSGNGLLGQGWSLSGLSAITRCRQTLIHDGKTNPITWSKEDRFCLDGQRLMLVSGTHYGQPNSEYRTEIDNYSLISAVGGSDGHPDYFKVEAKDGSISYYGFTSDSKLTGGVQNTTLNWALNRFQDNVGNGIDFVYSNDPASGQNIQEIRYGFSTTNVDQPSATRTDSASKITFNYIERDDKAHAYVAGYKFSQTRKLASVSIHNTDNSDGSETSKLFRYYELAYLSSTTTDARYENTLTRLSHIYECVTTNVVGGSCLLPLSFSWGGGSHIAFDKSMTELSFPTAEPGRYVLNNLFADVTGDGKVDLIYLTYEKGIDETHADLSINIGYAKNDATGLATQDRINLYNQPYENIRIATLDYNADGRQDLAVYNGINWKIHLAVVNANSEWRISTASSVNLSTLTDKDTLFMDVNGDGLADAVTVQGYYLLERNDNAGDSNTAYSFSVQLSPLTWANTGFAEISAPSPTSINSLTNCTQVGESKKLQQETAADFNGDGAVDFLGSYSRTLSCSAPGIGQSAYIPLTYRYALVNRDGQLFNYGEEVLQTPQALGGTANKLFSVDINSDGLSDIVQLGTDKTLSVRMNTGAGFNAAQAWTTLSGLPAGSSPQFLDYNGDGAADVIWRDTTKGQMLVHYWGTAATTTVTLFNAFSSEKDSYLVMDVSGDSVVDYLRISSESMSGWVGQMALKAEPVCETYPTGRGNEMRTQCNDPSYPIDENQQHSAIYKIENGLGNITEIAYGALSNSGRYQTADVNPELISTVVSNNCPSNLPAYCSPTSTTYSVDSSGFYGRINGPWELPADHNVYDPTTKVIVAAGTTTTKGNPVLEVNGSMQVVTTVKSSAPLPNTPQAMSEVNYFYGEAKMQAMGRGFLGFSRLKTVDKQTGITTVTTYRQDFPFAGSPLSTTVYKNELPNAPILNYAINKWDAQIFGGEGARRFQPYLKQSSEYSYVMDSVGNISTDEIQLVTTDTVMDSNEHGNVREVTTITVGSGKTLTQKTTNDYYGGDAWALRMGRLERSTVNTTSDTGDNVTRVAEFKYYGVGGEGVSGGAKGLLKEEKVVATNTSDELVTEYVYDQWGHKHIVSVKGQVGDGVQTRSTTYTYDPSGRNLESTKNHLNQESSFEQHNVYGQPQTATDKNKLSTDIKYDAFGSEYLRVEKLSAGETGAWTRKDSDYCTTSNCPDGAAFYTRARLSGGGEAVEYFDILGRVIRAGKKGFDGRWVYTATEYDHLSRVKRQSYQFYEGASPQDWTENHYDNLGRITQIDSPHELGTLEAKSEYTAISGGLVTTLINPRGQKRKEVRNGLGQLISVEDELGGSIEYEYSLLGGLLSVTTKAADAADVVVKMCYDELGRKTGMFDPDKGGFAGTAVDCAQVNQWTGGHSNAAAGWWHYRYNAFGELLEQRDPKGQRTLMQYDSLGRMINRKDYESSSHLEAHTAWFYDIPFGESAPIDKTQGKLTAVVMTNSLFIANSNSTCDKGSANHCIVYSYNDRGQIDMTWTLLPDGQDYHTETKYDTIGRAYEQRDVINNGPISMDSGVQTHFNENGYAYRTVDIAPWDGTDGVLSTIKEVNVNGQVTKELRGNGLESVTSYYPKSGLLQSQVTRDALNTRDLQSNHYTWDELGNLTSRVNRGAHVFKEGQPLQQNNRKESFCYDALNRLIKTLPTDNPICGSTSSPTDDIAYDGLGNITRKNGVGDYSYNRINGGAHAVTKAGNATYTYDNNGNMVAEKDSSANNKVLRAFDYTSYDMVKKITRDTVGTVEFNYGPSRARWQRIDNGVTTTTYLGNVERIERLNSTEIEWKRTVAGVVHTYKTTADADQQNLQVLKASKAYLYKDHLGSVDIITDQLGAPTHSMSFDPWGARRMADSNTITAPVKNAGETDQLVLQNLLAPLSLSGFSNPITTRGYTGHEMVDDMGIIHMNGRIYDPKLGRFLQADPFIQAATNTQSFNRYSYLLNNPLNATDPSGFFFKKLWNAIKPFVGAIVGIVIAVYAPWMLQTWYGAMAAGAISGAAGAAANGGNILKGAFTGGVAGVAFFGVGQYFRGLSKLNLDKLSKGGIGSLHSFGGNILTGSQIAGQIAAHAAVGGVMSVIQGGKFGNGFVSAGFTKGVTGSGITEFGSSTGALIGETFAAATVGGTVSEMTGGKFANGAQTAAFAYLFNQLATSSKQIYESWEKNHGVDRQVGLLTPAERNALSGIVKEKGVYTFGGHGNGLEVGPYSAKELVELHGEEISDSGAHTVKFYTCWGGATENGFGAQFNQEMINAGYGDLNILVSTTKVYTETMSSKIGPYTTYETKTSLESGGKWKVF